VVKIVASKVLGTEIGREALQKGRLSMVDLLVSTSLRQLLFILKILFTSITSYLNEGRSYVLSLPMKKES
jgi:hypothetical protein